MKTIVSIIKIILVFLFVAGAFLIIVNKTFIYEAYSGEYMEGSGIPISRFMYLIDEDVGLNAKFSTPLSKNFLVTTKDNYLNNLDECLGMYYYDKDNNITITKYNIVDHSYYRDVFISYAIGNYCNGDLELSDKWIYEYENLSKYEIGDISEDGMKILVQKIYDSKRVENPNIVMYNNELSLEVECLISNGSYRLIFQDFSKNELLVKKIMDGKEQIAVYEIDNVIEFLKGLDKTY